MPLPHLPARRRNVGSSHFCFWRLFIAGAAASGAMFGGAAFAQQVQIGPRVIINGNGRVINGRPEKASPDDPDSANGVYLPTDRALSRAVTRAKDRLADREYHEALQFLQTILDRDEDSFLERTAEGRDQLGLKSTVRKMIGDLPPDGVDAYELLQGPTARRQLEAALKAGDRDGVAKVVRQYFHTTAGYEATFVLAQMEADQSHRLAAAQLYQELIDSPRAAAKFEPQLSVIAGINQLAAGQPEAATTLIKNLIEQRPASEVTLSGKSFPLPTGSADLLAWLRNLVGELKTAAPSGGNWLTLHGDPSRNVQAPGGEPHLHPRWEARVVNDPALENFLTSRANDFLQRNVVAIPAARPIAVGDVIIMRTPENVVAVDWQTGKRVWETRDEQELDAEEAPADLAPGVDHDLMAGQAKPLEERMWDDVLATSLSSDGVRVFVVRGVQPGRDEFAAPMQMNIFGRPGRGLESVTITNQLAAYELATQGKLAWELDGGRTTGPLAGAFFLGPPLAIDNTLFTMAEIRGALYLLALDPTTGKVAWQQQLIGLEQGISLDVNRRRVGVTPSYAGGILVCPTAASATIGIDVVKREFAWVYRYPREAPQGAEARTLWQQQQVQAQLVRANDQWLDNSAIIAEDHVLLTPPESPEIHCLDLHTGKLAWKKRLTDALFVAGVDHGTVLVVGSQGMQALQLSDGAPAWMDETVSLPSGVLPAGQGYTSDGRYYVPLTSGQVAAIEYATGKITNDDPANPGISLGNLICYRGSVVSQSPLVLDKFEQLELLQKRTESAIAQNPNDASALRELAEIKTAAGDKPEAIRLLKQAIKLAPDDAVVQELLVDALLSSLATDYATYRDEVPLITKLIRTRDQRVELLRVDAAGKDNPESRKAAWDAYLQLADFTAEEPAYLQVDDHFTVRSDRWISSRLVTIWKDATPEERLTFTASIAKRRPALEKSLTSADARHFLAHMGELPGAGEVRLSLARFLIEHGRAQEAEIELLQLSKSPEQGLQSVAKELLTKLAAKFDGRATAASWPSGHVEVAMISAGTQENVQNRERPNRYSIERQNGYRQMRIEQDFLPGYVDTQWFVSMDLSEIVGRNALGDDILHWPIDQNALNRQFRGDGGFVHGARVGHLMFFTLGGQVMAMDSRADSPGNDSELLWPNRADDAFAIDAARTRRGSAGTARTSRPPVYHAYSGRRRVAGAAGNLGGALGPATPTGVVYQDQDVLKCVDPLTGTLLWVRSDVPAGCELFGDSELVFAADVAKNTAYVLRLSDGEMLGERPIPRPEWLLTTGRNVAQFTSNANRKTGGGTVTVTDIWSQENVYQGEFPATARYSVIEPNWLAVFEPAGNFQLVDMATGQTIIDEKLEPAGDLQTIQTLKFNDELYLFVSAQNAQQFKPIGQQLEYPLINGPVYAFDLKTGKALWPTPAIVRNRGLVMQQPADIPLLVFADRQMVRDAASGGGSQLRVLCLDRRTGQTVYRNDALTDTSAPRFRIHGDLDSIPQVALEMAAGKIQLAMTDRPRPPQPPANDDIEAPRENTERGLRAIGQQMGKALRGVFERQPNNQIQQTQPQPLLPNRAQPQAAPRPPLPPKNEPGDDD
ncbi:MAG: PQQ-binding-like beta-propeller repeat protein [Pirellulales bacterium]